MVEPDSKPTRYALPIDGTLAGHKMRVLSRAHTTVMDIADGNEGKWVTMKQSCTRYLRTRE